MKANRYSTTPSFEEISTRSRYLWQVAGRPDRRDLEFWLAAEIEVRREREETRLAIEEDSKCIAPTADIIRWDRRPQR